MKLPGAKASLFSMLLVCALGSRADEIIYENSENYLGRYSSVATEYGDEVRLGGTARTLTQFFYEYYGEFLSQADEVMKVRLYANDGPAWAESPLYITPGTVLFESGLIPVRQGFNTFGFSNMNVPLVDKNGNVINSLTWTVQFFGLTMNTTEGSRDVAGLMYYEQNPQIGGGFNDVWVRDPDPAGWTPKRFPSVTRNNFGAKMLAVPEPSALALGAIGLAALFLKSRRNLR